jgi:pimeloyl-ACP methyl ester carboxylesterase
MQPTVRESSGLAVYTAGDGAPVLVLPYPHASTVRPMGEDDLAQMLVELGRSIVTFDPPGAYRSTRPMRCDMAEMVDCAVEALLAAGVSAPVDVVGHSMGALCALALAVERPEMVRRLVLVGGCSGFAAVRRWSVPHNWSPWRDREWWACTWLGVRLMLGRGSLATYRRLDNLVERASYVDARQAQLVPVTGEDAGRPPPPRAGWLRTVRGVEYRDRLGEVRAPGLVVVGRHDPQTPLPCSQELVDGMPDARMVVFERSGHSPFVEEPDRFCEVVGSFLRRGADPDR